MSDFYADIDCPKCQHVARHVLGQTTGTVYCLTCSGECRQSSGLRRVAPKVEGVATAYPPTQYAPSANRFRGTLGHSKAWHGVSESSNQSAAVILLDDEPTTTAAEREEECVEPAGGTEHPLPVRQIFPADQLQVASRSYVKGAIGQIRNQLQGVNPGRQHA